MAVKGSSRHLTAEVHRWGATSDGVLIEFTVRGTAGGAPISWQSVDRFVSQRGRTRDRAASVRSAEIAATGLPVEVNVSGRSISDPRLLDHIEGAIQRTGADPKTMVFEITETTMVSNEDAARRFVERLHRLGCKIALDDFGTGYGGFTYVKQLPIDYLKIDIEFVRDLMYNPASRNVVQAIVKLVQGFGLKTIAERVEDEETMVLLRDSGVDYAQGYHIGRPATLTSAPPKIVLEGVEP